MTKPSTPTFLALLALAGCGDSPAPEKENREPTGSETSEPDARVANVDAGLRDATRPAADANDDPGEIEDASKREDSGSTEDASVDARTSEDARAADARVPQDAASLQTTTVRATIVVAAGQTYDGTGKRFVAGSELGDGSQEEGQKPVFKLESGATLRNVVIGAPAADGVHCHGDAQLENIVWEDIGEDALTIKESGTVELHGGSAQNGSDKVFQINAASSFRVYDFRARSAGKFIRQNGGTKFKVDVHIERCDISEMDEAIFRTDSELSTVTMIDTRYSQIGDALFVGVKASNISERNNSEY
jgi:pectate lyase C